MFQIKNKKRLYSIISYSCIILGPILIIQGHNIGMLFLAFAFHYGLKSSIEEFKKA